MIQSFHIGSPAQNKVKLLNFIRRVRKSKPGFKVIDVGAGADFWTRDICDAVVDLVPPNRMEQMLFFQGNFNDEETWAPLLAHVEKEGKFDFSICSHTLEDLADPVTISRRLGRISSAGYIAVPSKYRELARFARAEDGRALNWRGYLHHRWIFQIKNKALVGYPKLSFIDHDDYFDGIANPGKEISEICFFWKDGIPIRSVNDDFLGPTSDDIILVYRQGLINDDTDRDLGLHFQLA